MIESIKSNKYTVVLIALVNFLMTPLVAGVFGQNSSLFVTLNFSLVILAGFIAAERKIPKILSLIFGLATLISIWLEFIYGPVETIKFLRLAFSFALFILLAYILIRTIFDIKVINLKVLCGAMSGFILLGIIGGVIYETLELFNPGAVGVPADAGGYKFYYFSFINLTTVGFGDIVPISTQAQAITVLLSILGQFYMAIGVAVFIGKYLNAQNIRQKSFQ
jgi:hypothetical protein